VPERGSRAVRDGLDRVAIPFGSLEDQGLPDQVRRSGELRVNRRGDADEKETSTPIHSHSRLTVLPETVL